MAEVVKMPKLSDTMTEGVIAKWHKKIGDKVKSGELLAEIETDKATMDFESFQDGVLLHIGVEEKQPVPVDSIIAILGNEGEDISDLLKGERSASSDKKEETDNLDNKEKSSSAEKDSDKNKQADQASDNSEQKPSKQKEKTEKDSVSSNDISSTKMPEGVEIVCMPKLSDTMTEGVVAKWHKKVGDKVKSGDLLADIETDKATMEFESFQDGVLIYIGVEQGKSVPVDSVLAILGKGGEDVDAILKLSKRNLGEKKEISNDKKSEPVKEKTDHGDKKEKETSDNKTQSTTQKSSGDEARVKASPLAKAMAKEKGIDVSVVNGTGDNGRVTKKDIESFDPAKANEGSTATINMVGKESYTDEPASQMRKTIARRLLESTTGTPVFYLTIELDMDNAIAARTTINNLPDIKVSFNDLVIKASAAALRKHPKVNSSWLGDKIRINHHIHIGVAIAVEDGLLVPVVRFADQLSLSQISAQVKDLGKRAKDKKLQPADWAGNTFTVSNLGMFGITEFTSIINTPESCILSVGAISSIPVVKNNMVVPGNVMKVTLACDHRTVDGATGAAFLQTLKAYIENPVTMLA